MKELSDEEIKQRMHVLKVLCILTFIGSGLSAISAVSMFMMIDYVRNFYEQGMFDMLADSFDLESFRSMIYVNKTYFLVNGLLALGSVYGAYLMWNLRKTGFHVYTISQIFLLILPQLYFSGFPFPVFELLLSGVFVFLYSRSLSLMN